MLTVNFNHLQEEEEKNLEQRIQELLKYEDGKRVLFAIFTLSIKTSQGKNLGKNKLRHFSKRAFINDVHA